MSRILEIHYLLWLFTLYILLNPCMIRLFSHSDIYVSTYLIYFGEHFLPQMDRRMNQFMYYNFSYYYQYYIWRRRLLAAIALCLASYSYLLNMRMRDRRVTYGPLLSRDISRETRLNRLYNGSEAHCISELRMRKAVFHRLCGNLRSRGLLVDTMNVTVEEQLAMFMHVVGHNWSNRAVGFEFNRSGETVSRYFNAVLDALVLLARELIYIRSTETHEKITSSPGRFHPYFEVQS